LDIWNQQKVVHQKSYWFYSILAEECTVILNRKQ